MDEEDVVEGLHHARLRQVLLQELAGGGLLVVQLGEAPVTLGVVVVGVDDHLAAQRLDRHLTVGLQRHRHDDDVARAGRLGRRCRPGVRSELLHQFGEGLRAATVAEHHVVAGVHRQPRHGAADVSTADESDGCHVPCNPVRAGSIPPAGSAGPHGI